MDVSSEELICFRSVCKILPSQKENVCYLARRIDLMAVPGTVKQIRIRSFNLCQVVPVYSSPRYGT